MSYLYLGPGIGGGIFVIIIGVVVLLAITFYTFFWFPIKRYFKKKNSKK